MAKLTKKKTKAKAENQSEDFLQAIKELAVVKEISVELLFDAIEEAFKTAYKRNYGSDQNVDITLNRETGEYHIYSVKTVVADEEMTESRAEISLTEAQKINADYEVGDLVRIEVKTKDFGRIAAQAAKQTVIQRIREAERGNIYSAYQDRENDIVTGVVNRIENKNVYIDLGKTEAILGPNEQMRDDNYRINDRLKAYILEVKNASKGPQIMVSRTHPGLLKRLFELEVPEIHDGIVEIKSVAREPGMRSKIAVFANDEAVDPVGSCVGPRGLRVQNVVNELNNEKVDIIKWNEDPAKFIASALSPAKVLSVATNEAEKVSRVIVPDNQLSLAIGKEGQNACLAAKLTGWKIDIKSESQAEDDYLEDESYTEAELDEIDSVSGDEYAEEE